MSESSPTESRPRVRPASGNQPSLPDALVAALNERLDASLAKIRHCLDQLTEDQVWSRPRPEMNSIGNLLLHLAGNLRQWIVRGLPALPDDRDRPAEFAETGPLPVSEVWERLTRTVGEAQAVLRDLPPGEWTAPRRIQGFEVACLDAALDSVSHFRGHEQEIVHLSRAILGPAYRFEWTPPAESPSD